MAMETWELISYDVWGNEEDGFEVNAAYRTGRFVTFDSEISDSDLELAAVEWFGGLVEIDQNGSDNEVVYFIDSDNGSPAFEIQRITNNGDSK